MNKQNVRRHRDDRMDTTRDLRRTRRAHPPLARTFRPRPVELVPSSPTPRAPWSPEASVAPVPLAPGLGKRSIVLEHGSAMIRAGWAGRSKPDLAFPSLVGQLQAKFARQSDDAEAYFLGAEVLRKHQLLVARRPVERGVVQDFDQVEALWENCFSQLLGGRDLGELTDHCILLSSRQVAPFSGGADERAALAELALETFGFEACYVALPAVLCLYPGGVLTATVVDSGEGTTQVVPVYEGRYIRHAVTHLDVGGWDLTESLGASLQSEHKFETRNLADAGALRKIKEGLCYVASNYGRKLDAWVHSEERSKTYVVPGSGQITMGSARFQCAEALFTPQLLGKADQGMAQSTVDSIVRCDRSLIKTMFRNIVLAGGNSLLTGFEQRLQKDIEALAPECIVQCRPAVQDRRQMTDAAWLGGSILAAEPSFANRCLTREAAQEIGYHAVHEYF